MEKIPLTQTQKQTQTQTELSSNFSQAQFALCLSLFHLISAVVRLHNQPSSCRHQESSDSSTTYIFMNTEKLKRGLANVGTNIHYAGASLGSSVKNKLTGRSDYGSDDELISKFEHDIKQVVKAVKFLEKQSGRMAAKFWPYFFKSGSRSARAFLLLVGEDSLSFKDIEKYWEDFDKLQSTSETVQVHPKERQLVIPSIHYELVNYLATLSKLEVRVLELADNHSKKLKLRTGPFKNHMKHILKVVKARNSHRAKRDKLEWKTERLAKKKTPLSDQEQRDLDSLLSQLATANEVFENINGRLKTVIPESLLLVEEFVDELTKWTMCDQLQIYSEIDETLRYYAVFHGYVREQKNIEKAGNASENGNDNADNENTRATLLRSYEEIIDKWETECTPVRLHLESFLKTIYDKKPELLDQEVDDADKRLKVAKAWTLVTLKVTDKLHKIKALDLENGVFSETMVADPLVSYKKYQDASMNVSETYHPQKLLDYDDVHPDLPQPLTPPPLPPRDDTRLISFPMASTELSSPLCNIISSESLDSIHSDSELSLDSMDSDLESEAGSSVSDLSSVMLGDNPPDRAERQIIKLYNGAKNEITQAPLDTSKWPVLENSQADVFDSTNTASYKLHALSRFFQKALDLQSEKKVLVAKKDFAGVQPGDLSFKAGDKVDVLFDLQSVSSSYNEAGPNWFVGAVGDENHRRTGFAPNTYF